MTPWRLDSLGCVWHTSKTGLFWCCGILQPSLSSCSNTVRLGLLERASHEIARCCLLVGDKEEIHFLKGHARTIRVSYMLRPTGFQKGGNPYVVYNYLSLPVTQRTDVDRVLILQSIFDRYELWIWLGSRADGEIFFLICYHMSICVWQSHYRYPVGVMVHRVDPKGSKTFL